MRASAWFASDTLNGNIFFSIVEQISAVDSMSVKKTDCFAFGTDKQKIADLFNIIMVIIIAVFIIDIVFAGNKWYHNGGWGENRDTVVVETIFSFPFF